MRSSASSAGTTDRTLDRRRTTSTANGPRSRAPRRPGEDPRHVLHADTRYPPGSLILEAAAASERKPSRSRGRVRGRRSWPWTSPLLHCPRRAPARAPSRMTPSRSPRQTSTTHRSRPRRSTTFVCFVLEHLARPTAALTSLRSVLRPGGTITVIEGDHGSTYFHPESPHARRAIQCLIDLQARAGGNSLIGRALYPLLTDAGFRSVDVSPRMVYVDSSRPALVEGFTKNTFTAMVEGVRERSLAKASRRGTWVKGIEDLYRTAEADARSLHVLQSCRTDEIRSTHTLEPVVASACCRSRATLRGHGRSRGPVPGSATCSRPARRTARRALASLPVRSDLARRGHRLVRLRLRRDFLRDNVRYLGVDRAARRRSPEHGHPDHAPRWVIRSHCSGLEFEAALRQAFPRGFALDSVGTEYLWT